MYRLIVFLLAVAVLGSCGGGKDEGTQTTQQDRQVSTENQRPKGERMIADAGFSEFEKIAAAYLKPYFDAEGTDTVETVSPGDYFDMYVVAEFNELYPMSAAEYRLQLPPGVTIMSTSKSDSVIIEMGQHDNDIMMAFRCSSGPKLWLMKYVCKTNEDFSGGAITTLPGANLEFLGFTMCDATRTLIRARGGQAKLGVK